MSHLETPWTRLASRTLRGLLIRKGATYTSVAERLRRNGVDESVRSVEGKATRGTYSLPFFLLVLKALGAETPAHWRRAVTRAATAEESAKHIFLLELKEHDVDLAKLSKHLAKVGSSMTPEALAGLVDTGSFPFTLLLQLTSTADTGSLDRFVDHSDVLAAAAESKQPLSK